MAEQAYHIIFVRHGVSCANAHDDVKPPGDTSKYRDPELTNYGISLSKERRKNLEDLIENVFEHGGKPFTVGASCMIRAQETAYYQLLEGTKKSLLVFPHIGERWPKDPIDSPQADDNIPLPIDEQRRRLNTIDPQIVAKITADLRTSEGPLVYDPMAKRSLHRSNFESFCEWLALQQTKGNLRSLFGFSIKEGGTARAVLFTHAGFIDYSFRRGSPNNNDALEVKFTVDGLGRATITYAKLNKWGGKNHKKVSFPDGCRYPPGGAAGAAAPSLGPDAAGAGEVNLDNPAVRAAVLRERMDCERRIQELVASLGHKKGGRRTRKSKKSRHLKKSRRIR
jgi:hypothetical protein